MLNGLDFKRYGIASCLLFVISDLFHTHKIENVAPLLTQLKFTGDMQKRQLIKICHSP